MKAIIRILWATLVVLPWLFIGVAALASASTAQTGAAIALFCIIMGALAWDKLSEYDGRVR